MFACVCVCVFVVRFDLPFGWGIRSVAVSLFMFVGFGHHLWVRCFLFSLFRFVFGFLLILVVRSVLLVRPGICLVTVIGAE